MASPDYSVYTPAAPLPFVDDSGGSGGTVLNAVDLNHLADDPAAHADAHINGVANHHGSIDILDFSGSSATTLTEAQSPLYTNTTLLGDIVIGGIHYYSQYTRNDQWATLFKSVIGGSGTLTTRATTLGSGALSLTSLTTILGGSGTPTFSAVTASEFIGVAPNSGTPAGWFKNDAADEGGYIFLVTDHAGSTVWLSVTKITTAVGGNLTVAGTSGLTGNVSLGGTLSVTGTTSHTGVVTFAAAPVFQVGTTMSSLIGDYKASPGAANHIAVAAGPAFLDSQGNWLGPFGALSVALPSQPGSSNIQYVWISMAPSTGTLVATGGTVSPAPPIPIFPTGNEPVALVTWRASAPAGVVASSDIQDARFWGHTIGSVQGLNSSSTLWTVGVPSTSGDTSGIQGTTILKGTASGTVNSETFTPLNSGGSNATSANVGIYAIGSGDVAQEGGGTPDTNLGIFSTKDIMPAMRATPFSSFVIAGATIAFAAGSGMMINGHMKYNAAQSATATASSSAGIRDVFADSTSNGGVSGNEFTITIQARGAAFSSTIGSLPNANCRWMGAILWDGTNIVSKTESMDLSSHGIVTGGQMMHGPPSDLSNTMFSGGTQTLTTSSPSLVKDSSTNAAAIQIFCSATTNFLVGGSYAFTYTNVSPLVAAAGLWLSGVGDFGSNKTTATLTTADLTSSGLQASVFGSTTCPTAGMSVTNQYTLAFAMNYLQLSPGRHWLGILAYNTAAVAMTSAAFNLFAIPMGT